MSFVRAYAQGHQSAQGRKPLTGVLAFSLLDDMSIQLPPTFCVLPWIHVSTKTNGEMRLCCTTCASSAGKDNKKELGGKLGVNRLDDGRPANLSRTPLLEGWNNTYMKTVRRQMLNGEIPPSCAKCFREESNGLTSKRRWETDYWSNKVDIPSLIAETDQDGRVPDRIRYFDLRLGHKCNLRCSMCSPHDSSGWIGDWDKIVPEVKSPRLRELMSWEGRGRAEGASYEWFKNPDFWRDFDTQIGHIRQIYFAGGEPLLIEEHYRILERAIELGVAGRIELRYNSNGTVLPERVLKLWQNFKRVRFGFSLDSFGERNRYIRFPADWNAIERHLRRLDETPDNIEVTLACAVQILNVMDLPDFIKWKLSQNFKKINAWPNGAGLINFHLVYHPAFLNICVLPKTVKDRIAEKYDEFERWLIAHHRSDEAFLTHNYGLKRLKGIIKFMRSDDWSVRLPEFREYIAQLDRVRGTSFESTFPELARALDEAASGETAEIGSVTSAGELA